MCVHSEHTKQVAERSIQSKSNNVDTQLFSWAFLLQKNWFAHIGHCRFFPLISTVCGSFFLNSFI